VKFQETKGLEIKYLRDGTQNSMKSSKREEEEDVKPKKNQKTRNSKLDVKSL
jgi:hypothetical protein